MNAPLSCPSGSNRDNSAPVSQTFPAMTPALYRLVHRHLVETDPDATRIIDWARHDLLPPDTPLALAQEVIWIILCAGRTAQSARTIEGKVLGALAAGNPVLSVFGHRMRAAAIERAWNDCHQDFAGLARALAEGPDAVVAWAGTLPGVGQVTRYQLAKNLGCPVVKPDLWLTRYAGIPPDARMSALERFQRCQLMALGIAAATGDPVPVVDSVLWLAGSKGLLQVTFSPHRISFSPGLRRGSIF